MPVTGRWRKTNVSNQRRTTTLNQLVPLPRSDDRVKWQNPRGTKRLLSLLVTRPTNIHVLGDHEGCRDRLACSGSPAQAPEPTEPEASPNLEKIGLNEGCFRTVVTVVTVVITDSLLRGSAASQDPAII